MTVLVGVAAELAFVLAIGKVPVWTFVNAHVVVPEFLIASGTVGAHVVASQAIN